MLQEAACDGASMEVFLNYRKNDQYRQGSHILLTAINLYACPVQLTAMLSRWAGLVDGSRPSGAPAVYYMGGARQP